MSVYLADERKEFEPIAAERSSSSRHVADLVRTTDQPCLTRTSLSREAVDELAIKCAES
jgi:hypothetical protein